MNPVNVSVVIATRNRKNILFKTVQSILLQKTIPSEIIIVDQSDEPIHYPNDLPNTSLASIRVIYQDQPCLTKARNRGIDEAINNIVLFCDDDVIFLNDCIKHIIYHMNNQAVMVAAYDQLTKKDEGTFDWGLYLRVLFFKGKVGMQYGYVCRTACGGLYPTTNRTIPTEWAMGYFFAIRKDLAQEWQVSFDENLLTYGYAEDLDFSFRYCKKAAEMGYSSIIANEIMLEHKTALGGRISSDRIAYMYVIHRYYLSQKLFGKIGVLGLFWSDVHEIMRRLVRGDNAFIIIKAHIKAIKHLKTLRKAKINSELYELMT